MKTIYEEIKALPIAAQQYLLKRRRATCTDDFIDYYLGHHLEFKTPPMHREWTAFEKDKRVLLAAPRFWAKTFRWSFAYALRKALTSPGLDILQISKTKPLAQESLEKSKYELETNERLIEDFGDQRTDRWRQDHLRLRNGSRIMAKGAGFQVRGFHPPLIILDDLEDEKTVWSETYTKKLAHWLATTLTNCLPPDGQLVYIGSNFGPRSLMGQLLKHLAWKKFAHVYRAIEYDRRTGVRYSTWPDKWTLASLDQRCIEIGTTNFSAEFQNDPVPDGERWFKKIGTFKRSELPSGLFFYLTIDPALSKKRSADLTGLVIGATDHKGPLHITHYEKLRIPPEQLVEKVFQLDEQLNFKAIGIESVGMQQVLSYWFRAESRRRGVELGNKLIDLWGGNLDAHTLRIRRLVYPLDMQSILIAEDLLECRSDLEHFPDVDKVDGLDALGYQYELVGPQVTAPPAEDLIKKYAKLDAMSALFWRNVDAREKSNSPGGLWGAGRVYSESKAREIYH